MHLQERKKDIRHESHQTIPTHFNHFASRGGVLEPEGTVEIKFRKKDLVKTMRRVDPVYMSLAERLGEPSTSDLIIALHGCLFPTQPCPHFSKRAIHQVGVRAFLPSFFTPRWLYHLLCFSLGRCVNHSLLRSIHSFPAQCIDFPPGSVKRWSCADAVWALGDGWTGGMGGLQGEGGWEVTDWNWQKSVYGDSHQGFGATLR